jgi:hypothetical protein
VLKWTFFEPNFAETFDAILAAFNPSEKNPNLTAAN